MKHSNSEKLVKAIRRKTRWKYSAEEKIRIVLELWLELLLIDLIKGNHWAAIVAHRDSNIRTLAMRWRRCGEFYAINKGKKTFTRAT